MDGGFGANECLKTCCRWYSHAGYDRCRSGGRQARVPHPAERNACRRPRQQDVLLARHRLTSLTLSQTRLLRGLFLSGAVMAYTNVRRGGKPIEAAEQYLGADRTISIDDIGSGTGDIEVVDRVLTTDKLETEKFMAEKVTVMVHESNDDADDDFCSNMGEWSRADVLAW